MTIKMPALPPGISHEPDLSKLTHPERMKAHRKALPHVFTKHGWAGVTAYKERYPEAYPLRVGTGRIVAYTPKPKGYADRVISHFIHCCDSELARRETNGALVRRWNDELSMSLDPSRFLSKPFPKSLLEKIAAALAEKGITLPASAKTRSAIVAAIESQQAGATPDAHEVAPGLFRTGDVLAIGCKTYKVCREARGGEFLWMGRRRIYLDDLIEIFRGWAAGNPSGVLYYVSSMGEQHNNPEKPRLPASAKAGSGESSGEPHNACAAPPREIHNIASDPLEFAPGELSELLGT